MKIHQIALTSALLMMPLMAGATKLIDVRVLDKDYIVVHFRDGEVRYRDNGTGPSAFLGHTFVEGDDTLKVFGAPLNAAITGIGKNWSITSKDGTMTPQEVYRCSKPMNTDHTLHSELDHWLYLRLPSPMRQGQTYTVHIPSDSGTDKTEATLTYDIWNSQSEAVHVNIMGYGPQEKVKEADLYHWMGDGGQRNYSSFVDNKVYLLNTATNKKTLVGQVKPWKTTANCANEAGGKNLTGSDVWNIDFANAAPGRYRLVVDGVGCSMDFNIGQNIYYEPYRYSVRGYYYMRVGEPADAPNVSPVPRQPRFIPGVSPTKAFTIYKTNLTPWSDDWKALRMDVWDECHFKPAEQSLFWKHRLPGNPTVAAGTILGGHSDAMDWDRHIAHVANIYDMLMPYILHGGKKLNEDNLGIRESGNGIPDIIDEARNEVDFFLSIRDGEAYSQGLTNPTVDWTVMFQAGCTTMAAWANAANCAMLAEAFRLNGNATLRQYYQNEAIKAFNFASKQKDLQLDEMQNIGTVPIRGRDLRQMAAAFLYNLTGQRKWEKIMAADSEIRDGHSQLFAPPTEEIGGGVPKTKSHYQIWAAVAYVTCPHQRHYPELYRNLLSSIRSQAEEYNVSWLDKRPSRRVANDTRHITSENLQLVLLAHYVAQTDAERSRLEQAMYSEAGWGLGRNPQNIVEMTGLGQRHFENVYSTGRNDGAPGTHPGQTPFNGTEIWTKGDGGDATLLTGKCYPSWQQWPKQASYFNQRYLWVNAEFTPRETMRGKMALYGYLYGLDTKK